MIVLQIEHEISNFDGWKKVFESDPINRKQSGVRRYTIFRPVDDPNHVIINLEFDNLTQAESTVTALRSFWKKVEGKIMTNPQTRILDLVETNDV